MAWEAISNNAAITAFIRTLVWFVAMAVHSVGFALMTEEAGRGRETRVFTSNNLAPVRPQMRIDEFAGTETI